MRWRWRRRGTAPRSRRCWPAGRRAWWCRIRRRPARSPRRRSRLTGSLAGLLAANHLPSVWLPDPQTAALRRQVLRRAHLVRQRTRLKNQIHAILHRNLVPRCPAADLFGHKGRRWLAAQELPADEQAAAAALLRQLDFHTEELRVL